MPKMIRKLVMTGVQRPVKCNANHPASIRRVVMKKRSNSRTAVNLVVLLPFIAAIPTFAQQLNTVSSSLEVIDAAGKRLARIMQEI